MYFKAIAYKARLAVQFFHRGHRDFLGVRLVQQNIGIGGIPRRVLLVQRVQSVISEIHILTLEALIWTVSGRTLIPA